MSFCSRLLIAFLFCATGTSFAAAPSRVQQSGTTTVQRPRGVRMEPGGGVGGGVIPPTLTLQQLP